MKILLFCGDEYHPGHIPTEGLKSLNCELEIINVIPEDFVPDFFDYSVIIMSKSDHISETNLNSWKTPEIQEAIIKFVENGGGLLVTHSGLVSSPNTKRLDEFIGSRFSFHPSQSPIYVETLKPHPVVPEALFFREEDEHYALEILSGDIDIFLASYSATIGDLEKINEDSYNNSPAKLATAGYSLKRGKGRVVVLTPGHNLAVWRNQNYQKILRQALNWLRA